MNLSTFRNNIQTNGYVVLENLCDEKLIAQILAVARRKAAATRTALGERDIGIGSAAGFNEIVQRSPGRWDVPISPDEFGVVDNKMPWWDHVTAILGDDAEHSFSGVVSSDPGSPAQRWHTDSPHLNSEHRHAHAVNVLIALQDISLEMGPTEVAAGSHQLTNHLANPSLVADELIYQDVDTPPEQLVKNSELPVPERFKTSMHAGTCLIFDDRLLHRGLANHSAEVRHVAYFSYRQRGYSENTHFESSRSIHER
ncbi:MAG: phytanoyl-CoA dioxygenase family protein [Pseudomonadota bacterium]